MPAVQNTIVLSWIVIDLLAIKKKNIALVLADFLKIGKIRTPSHFGQFFGHLCLEVLEFGLDKILEKSETYITSAGAN